MYGPYNRQFAAISRVESVLRRRRKTTFELRIRAIEGLRLILLGMSERGHQLIVQVLESEMPRFSGEPHGETKHSKLNFWAIIPWLAHCLGGWGHVCSPRTGAPGPGGQLVHGSTLRFGAPEPGPGHFGHLHVALGIVYLPFKCRRSPGFEISLSQYFNSSSVRRDRSAILTLQTTTCKGLGIKGQSLDI